MTAHDKRPPAPSHDRVAPPWRQTLRTRGLRALLAIELLVALAVALGLWALRQQTLDGELRSLAALSAAMAARADASLDLAGAVVRATRDELAAGTLRPGRGDTQALLSARAAALPGFLALTVFDADGTPAASFSESPGPQGSAARRGFFVAARKAGESALVVGNACSSGIDGRPGIRVSLAVHDDAGAFRGVVALVVDPEALAGGFARIAPSADMSLAIYRRDRALVSDGAGGGAVAPLPPAAIERLWTDARPGRPRLETLADGRQLLLAAHALRRWPLMTVLTRDAGAALAGWTELAWLAGAFASSALVLALALGLRQAREQALRQACEAALASEQARTLRAFQAEQEGHWEWNAATHETRLSPRMKQLLGLAAGEEAPAGAPPGPLAPGSVHPDDAEPLRAAFLAHEQGRTPSFEFTFRVRRPDRGWRHVCARGQAWRNADGRPPLFSGTAVDLTGEVEGHAERRRLEEQLQRALKLEALGTLAGGVAHDFNNILASVVGYAELARATAAAGSAQARQLDQVLQAGQRGKALVERILSFSRGAPRPHTTFLLQPLVAEVLQLLAASLPAQLTIDARLHAPHAAIDGDPTLVYEAMTNLCTNGLQAMREQAGGGRLQVELRIDEVARAGAFRGDAGARALRPPERTRPGAGHRAAGDAAALRALLHHQGRAARHGPRPGRGSWGARGSGWRDRRAQHTRPGRLLHGLLPARRERGRRRSGVARCAAARRGPGRARRRRRTGARGTGGGTAGRSGLRGLRPDLEHARAGALHAAARALRPRAHR